MSLYDVIASAQQGQCYANLARRFGVEEDQAADAVYHLIRAMLPGLGAWISTKDGLLELLASFSGDGYEQALLSADAMADRPLRDRGAALVTALKERVPLDPDCIRSAATESGLAAEMLSRLLPYAAVLMMAALRQKADQPMRAVLARLRGSNAYAATIRDPAGAMHRLLTGTGQEPAFSPLRRVLGGFLGTPASNRPSMVATGSGRG